MRIILVSILLFLFSYNLKAKENYYNLIDSVENCIKKENWEQAEKFLIKILQSYPDDNNNSLIISNLATIQRNQGKYSEAIKNYSFAIHITPNATTLIRNRASLYLELDSIDKAKDDFERLLLIDEKDEESRYFHGMLSIRLGNMKTAKEDFDYILHYNPYSGVGREGLALWYKENEDYIRAVQIYTELINHRQNSLDFSNRAECYLGLKKYNEASDDLKKAISLAPNDGFLYILKAKLNKAQYQYKDMEQNIDMAVKLGYDKIEVEKYLNTK